jgi:hypothetical protein
MTNRPYVKQYNQDGEVINAITKGSPYLHKMPTTAFMKKYNSGKYIIIENPVTKQFIAFGSKAKGNNRANSSSRKGKNSRAYA